jgi:transcriptional regulator with XRE-family HTH domain
VFKDLLLRLLPDARRGTTTSTARFPSQRALAKALGVEANTIGRILRSDDVLDIPGCLRLAQLGPYAYKQVLTLARKPEVAALIEALAGPMKLTAEERHLIVLWRTMPDDMTDALLAAFSDFARRYPRPRSPR